MSAALSCPQIGAHAGGGERVRRGLDHARAGSPQSRCRQRSRVEQVERGGRREHVGRVVWRRAQQAGEIRVGDRRHQHRVAAREHRHGLNEGARGGVVEQIAQHEHQRPLAAGDGLKGLLVVAVEQLRLEVEQRRDDLTPAAAPRGQLSPRPAASNAIAPQ